MFNRNTYIAQLPIEKQDRIEAELRKFYAKEFPELGLERIKELISEVMCNRIWVLEDGFSDLLDKLGI